MSKKIILALIAITTLASCSKNSEETIAFMKASILENYNNGATFETYAMVTKVDSAFQTAALFRAAAESQRVQAAKYTATLNELDIFLNMDASQAPAEEVFKKGTVVSTTGFVNRGEKIIELSSSKLEAFIKDTKKSTTSTVDKLFVQTKVINGKIANYFTLATSELESARDMLDSDIWHVCTVCGDIYSHEDLSKQCDLCKTPATNFKEFKAE